MKVDSLLLHSRASDPRMVCQVEGDVSELVDRVDVFTYPRQFDPGTALYDDGKVITLPPIPVSVIPVVERAPVNVGDVETLKTDFTVSAETDVTPTTTTVLDPLGLNVTAPVAVNLPYGRPITKPFPFMYAIPASFD